jgi:hypothetical protein
MFQQAEIKQFAKSDTSVLKQHYEKSYLSWSKKRNRESSSYFTNVSSSTNENAQKLKETYLLKLNALESPTF